MVGCVWGGGEGHQAAFDRRRAARRTEERPDEQMSIQHSTLLRKPASATWRNALSWCSPGVGEGRRAADDADEALQVDHDPLLPLAVLGRLERRAVRRGDLAELLEQLLREPLRAGVIGELLDEIGRDALQSLELHALRVCQAWRGDRCVEACVRSSSGDKRHLAGFRTAGGLPMQPRLDPLVVLERGLASPR